jgi:hypothetical protein
VHGGAEQLFNRELQALASTGLHGLSRHLVGKRKGHRRSRPAAGRVGHPQGGVEACLAEPQVGVCPGVAIHQEPPRMSATTTWEA